MCRGRRIRRRGGGQSHFSRLSVLVTVEPPAAGARGHFAASRSGARVAMVKSHISGLLGWAAEESPRSVRSILVKQKPKAIARACIAWSGVDAIHARAIFS